MIRLGVNIDHVATIRNARGETYPDPVQAAVMAELGGADNITCHLREDRRHIRDRDVRALKDSIQTPLNFEIAATAEMLKMALEIKPHAVTLVPERREELTTEGGLNLKSNFDHLAKYVDELREQHILVSLFVDANKEAIDLTKKLNAHAVEIHAGDLCLKLDQCIASDEKNKLINDLNLVTNHASEQGLQVHIGHGINYANASWFQKVNHLEEANIGHSIVGRSIFVGLKEAVVEMRDLINNPARCPF